METIANQQHQPENKETTKGKTLITFPDGTTASYDNFEEAREAMRQYREDR